jgi:hypothetical protein
VTTVEEHEVAPGTGNVTPLEAADVSDLSRPFDAAVVGKPEGFTTESQKDSPQSHRDTEEKDNSGLLCCDDQV